MTRALADLFARALDLAVGLLYLAMVLVAAALAMAFLIGMPVLLVVLAIVLPLRWLELL